jgi:hypothetical protein
MKRRQNPASTKVWIGGKMAGLIFCHIYVIAFVIFKERRTIYKEDL